MKTLIAILILTITLPMDASARARYSNDDAIAYPTMICQGFQFVMNPFFIIRHAQPSGIGWVEDVGKPVIRN
jgi:hypothetical protein